MIQIRRDREVAGFGEPPTQILYISVQAEDFSVGRLLGAALVGAVAASMGGGTVGYQAAFVGLVMLAVLVLLMAMTLKSRATERIDGEKADEEPAAKSATG